MYCEVTVSSSSNKDMPKIMSRGEVGPTALALVFDSQAVPTLNYPIVLHLHQE